MSDWLSLPNLHPAVVHFPIALIPTALVVDIAALVSRRLHKGDGGLDWLARSASLLYVLAALCAFGALETGEEAADSFVSLPAAMQPRIAAHSDAAHWAAYLLGAVAVLHLGVRFLERRTPSDLARGGLVLLAIANVVLVLRAADLGGALVYRHGLGVVVGVEGENGAPSVTEETSPAPSPSPSAPPEDGLVAARSRLRTGADDAAGVDWRPQQADGAVLYRLVDVATGFSRAVATPTERQGKGDDTGAGGLPLQVSGATLLLVPGVFGDVQVEAELEVGTFTGTIGLAHHVNGAEQRGVFALSSSGEASLVDLRDGSWTVLDEEPTDRPSGRVELAVSSVGRHLKGMVGGETAVHGHISPSAEGRCGLLLEGEGRLRILAVRVIPL
jgi:uncharacterized membrane protein